MTAAGQLFCAVGALIAMEAAVYWLVAEEPAGLALMAVAVALSLLCGGYCLWTGRSAGARPEDSADGEPADAAGVVGWFSPASAWPFAIGVSAMLVALGFVFGWAPGLIGAALLAVSTGGLLLEGLDRR